MISFSVFDYIIIGLYFVIVLYVGLRTKSSDKSTVDYLVAGRVLTLPAFVATLVSTFYGGVLGVGEFTYRFGISSWFLNAFPYYFFIVIFAFFLSRKIRKTELFTIPDKLEQTYGKKVGLFGAILIFFLVTPAPYLLMLGIITQVIFGIPLFWAMIICLLFSIVYLFKGGLLADVRVNIVEFIIMFAGFGLILPFCFFELGGLDYLKTNLPTESLSLTGGNSLQYMLVWFFIGAWALVDPSFHQRCYAAKNGSIAKNGVLISLIFWFIFDFLTTTAGLYARADLPNIDNPAMSYPLLADKILPPIAKGLFFTGMIATIMSTLHSYIFISATTLGNDIIPRIKHTGNRLNEYSKIGIIITSVVSILIVIWIPSVVNIWYTVGSIIIPALLISIISSYTKRFTISPAFILGAMIASFSISLICMLYGQFNLIDGYASYPFDIEPMYPGLFVGIIIYSIGFIIQNINRKPELAGT
ncbi:MAG: sodium:solute symporter family protein [Ignavibacteriae bacterium]|nr:sodium:solute symporter family protein [Ignavibacteriota bacterium]MCB9242922.1 sodium:solute symporter family protein [Ignavibacteriales bacterium]